eukprot:Opistho-2@65133
MASQPLFVATAAFKAALELINGLDDTKLPLVLVKIVQRLHLKEHTFSPEEKEQLVEVLEIEDTDLESVVETSSFIFEQSAYLNVKPDALGRHLIASGASEEKAQTFSAVWAREGSKYVSRLRDQPFFPTRLSSVNWSLNLQMSTASLAKLKSPAAFFDLGLDGETGEKDHVRIEFNHAQLLNLYNQMETVQEQLDQLS